MPTAPTAPSSHEATRAAAVASAPLHEVVRNGAVLYTTNSLAKAHVEARRRGGEVRPVT